MDMGWLVLIVIGAIVAAVIKWKIDTKRREDLAALAAQGKWDFSPAKDTGIGRLCDFDLFNRGTDRYAYNTITGKAEYGGFACELDMGDFCYTIEHHNSKGQRSRTRHHFSYLVVRLPFRDFPAVKLRREGLLDKLTQAIGFEDIDFESEEFSRKWCVTSNDKRFAYDLIHPRTMEYMLQIEPPRMIELAAGRICVTDGVRRWNPEDFRKRMNWARNFVALWPEHLAAGLRRRTN
jgi:hypothetical protein